MKPIPGLQLEAQPEEVVIPCLIWGEARGEPNIGKLAVAWVVKNRSLKHGTTMKQEALKPLQFSSFNANDPNRTKLLQAPMLDPLNWARCELIYDLLNYTIDPTHGATHYYNAKIVSPTWAQGPQWLATVEFGNHKFGQTA